MSKKYFFGWGNIKKGITEIIRIYSEKPSFFSKKRIESGLAFIIAEWGMIFYLLKKYPDLTMTDMVMWATIQFGVSGYIIYQIQKEKKKKKNLPQAVKEENPKRKEN